MSEKEDAYLLWGAEQQRQAAEKLAEEQTRAFDRVRSRLTTFLPVLTTLSLGSMAGAVSRTDYAPLCSILAAGFVASAFCCMMGLRTNHDFKHATPSREMTAKIIEDARCYYSPQTVAVRMVALFIEKKLAGRGRAIWRDRRWLQRAIWGTLLTPGVSLALFLLFQQIKKFC